MNYIWRCLVRKTCSPALFSPLFPRPPEAVVVKHVVVQQRSRGMRLSPPAPGASFLVFFVYVPDIQQIAEQSFDLSSCAHIGDGTVLKIAVID